MLNQTTRIYAGMNKETSVLVQWHDGVPQLLEVPAEFTVSQMQTFTDTIETLEVMARARPAVSASGLAMLHNEQR